MYSIQFDSIRDPKATGSGVYVRHRVEKNGPLTTFFGEYRVP